MALLPYDLPLGVEGAGPSGGSAPLSGPLRTFGNAQPGGLSPADRLDPRFTDRITQMVQDMPPELAAKFGITSGYRSAERQAQVNPSVKHSLHTAGFAADTTRDPAMQDWIMQNGPKYGVGYTLAGMPGEDNHLEMLGARDTMLKAGGAIPSAMARFGQARANVSDGGIIPSAPAPAAPPASAAPPAPADNTPVSTDTPEAAQGRAAAYMALANNSGGLGAMLTNAMQTNQAPAVSPQPVAGMPGQMLPGQAMPFARRLG